VGRGDGDLAGNAGTEAVLVDWIPHWWYVGDTSLHLASAALLVEVARVLLQAGADPNAANRRGATPLHYACDPRPKSGGTWNPDAQVSIIKLLVERGADLEQPDPAGAATTPPP